MRLKRTNFYRSIPVADTTSLLKVRDLFGFVGLRVFEAVHFIIIGR